MHRRLFWNPFIIIVFCSIIRLQNTGQVPGLETDSKSYCIGIDFSSSNSTLLPSHTKLDIKCLRSFRSAELGPIFVGLFLFLLNLRRRLLQTVSVGRG